MYILKKDQVTSLHLVVLLIYGGIYRSQQTVGQRVQELCPFFKISKHFISL